MNLQIAFPPTPHRQEEFSGWRTLNMLNVSMLIIKIIINQVFHIVPVILLIMRSVVNLPLGRKHPDQITGQKFKKKH